MADQTAHIRCNQSLLLNKHPEIYIANTTGHDNCSLCRSGFNFIYYKYYTFL